jgi:chemotaxis protein methyltransferase CheR
MVEFKQLNLVAPASPFPQADIVFLRNVLIYFDLPIKQKVVRSILSRLRPGGVLFVGMAESLNGVVGELQALSPGAYTVRSEASR